jgi:5-formyltetrahydrofolate cyclo-ligase
VPGLGFGRDGTRLGRGKGHYDRFLPGLSSTAFLCGVCFRCQVSDALPVESHDVPMDALLTESGWEDTSPCPRPSVP